MICPRVGGFGSLFYRKFINCLLKHWEIWKKGQFKHQKLLRYLRIRRYQVKLLRMKKVARNTRSCRKLSKPYLTTFHVQNYAKHSDDAKAFLIFNRCRSHSANNWLLLVYFIVYPTAQKIGTEVVCLFALKHIPSPFSPGRRITSYAILRVKKKFLIISKSRGQSNIFHHVLYRK